MPMPFIELQPSSEFDLDSDSEDSVTQPGFEQNTQRPPWAYAYGGAAWQPVQDAWALDEAESKLAPAAAVPELQTKLLIQAAEEPSALVCARSSAWVGKHGSEAGRRSPIGIVV